MLGWADHTERSAHYSTGPIFIICSPYLEHFLHFQVCFFFLLLSSPTITWCSLLALGPSRSLLWKCVSHLKAVCGCYGAQIYKIIASLPLKFGTGPGWEALKGESQSDSFKDLNPCNMYVWIHRTGKQYTQYVDSNAKGAVSTQNVQYSECFNCSWFQLFSGIEYQHMLVK